MEALLNLITGLGVLAVIAVVYAESGLLIGFFLPGDSLLFTSGFLVQQNIFTINIHLFVFLLFIAAVLGDSTGYTFGRRVGRRLFDREDSKFFKKEHLLRAEQFYQKHGSKTIVLARFVPFVRTFAPIVAGVSQMSYRHFLIYNILGAALWTASFTYLGYFAGSAIKAAGINVEVAALIIIAISIAPMIIHALKEPTTRNKLIEGTKHQIRVLLRK